MSAPSSPTPTIAPRQRWALIQLGVLVALSVLVILYQLWLSHEEEIKEAEQYTRSHADVLAPRLESTFRHADRILVALSKNFPPAALAPATHERYTKTISEELRVRMLNFDELAGLRIDSADGTVTYRSYGSPLIRDKSSGAAEASTYMLPALTNKPDALAFSAVTTQADSGREILVIARAIRDTEGKLIGRAVAEIDLAYFQNLFQSIAVTSGAVVSLRRTDDKALVTRWPEMHQDINRRLEPEHPIARLINSGKQAGTLDYAFQTDAVRRITSFKVLTEYPFYFNVGVSKDEALAGWRIRAMVVGFSGILIIALLAGLLARLWRAGQREARVLANLSASDQRLRTEREQLEIFRRLSDAASQGICMITMDGRITYANPALRQMIDLPANMAEGAVSSQKFFSVLNLERMQQEIIPYVLKAGRWTGEMDLSLPDGRIIPAQHNIFVIKDATGKPQALANVLLDLRDRKQMEARTQSLMAEMETLLSNALVGIVHLRHRRIISCNRRLEELFGYEPGELLGELSERFYASQEDFDRIGVEAYATIGEDRNYSVELPLRRKDGTLFAGALTGRAIDPAHPQEGSIWVYADITEQKLAQQESQRLRQAVDQSPVMIFMTNTSGVIEYVNPTFTRVTGFSEDDAVGKTPRILKSGKNPPEFYADLWNTLLAGKVWNGTLRNRCKDGRLIWVDATMSAIVDSNGRATHFMAVEEDISNRVAAESQLRESEETFRHLFEDVTDPLLLLKNGRFVDCNSATLELLRFPDKATFLNVRPHEISPPIQPDGQASDTKAEAIINAALNTGHQRFEWVHRRYDGTDVPVEVTLTPIVMGGETILHTMWRDITERQAAETRLRLLAGVFEHSAEAIMITDRENRILEVNAAFTRLTGYDAEEARGRNPNFLSSGQTPPEIFKVMWQSIQSSGHWKGEIWDRRKDGSVYPKWLLISTILDRKGEIEYFVGSFVDISERKEAEEKISHLAHFDSLTDLPNRFSLQERLEQALATARREGDRALALMFLDLDRFKNINDTLGHHIGDELLLEVARRLQANVRDSDIVARLGGDEFVVVLIGIGPEAAERVSTKLRQALELPYHIGNNDLHTTASIGIALFPDDGNSVEELMQNADAAMYHAKALGRNNVQFFTASMNEAARERHHLEGDLHLALERSELELHYQPQINGERRTVGAEALLRWKHPEQGMISPLKFIPLAEETGLILPIGKWVLDTACAQLLNWAKSDATRHLQLAVNVSARQFRQTDFVEQIRALLQDTGIEPSRLKLELTESLVLDDIEDTIEKMLAIRKFGVLFSMDDFGTGYSSLSYLARLPLDQLKIDRAFVTKLPDSPSDAIIAQTIVTMGRSLGLDVIAEGVETEAQCRFLDRHGCHAYQGYLFARPLPAMDFASYIQSRNR